MKIQKIKSNNSLAFTLVELIVVITILAILGTIAFISLQ
ncbi:prepilin-type N-terminal cleavage/methylation domain-containing protein [bacterium]|nr:prepilin-type N-terminal cleavage/methylation domain-containing protein [bacterium]MBT3853619.1 prepilin-type N-terminal cleavage/methylation domain-containing protein [bacterium]MBT4633088.1 prepilin-type N-terminal cleavage/methylation domain-containing protein [bacterium]MBT6778633.1 prepilin-type N-terminal cleavage/methylation domain-containing protein [bacterium]